jgi:hypothetical protein
MDDVKTDEPGSLAVASRPLHPEDNWLEFIGAGVAAGFANSVGADVYNDVKAACRAAVEKFRDQRTGPDEELEWVHQIVAESFIGPCPPGHKLVHLDGIPDHNHLGNLAYVPESDPRPAAPLKPRPPGWPTKSAVTPKTAVSRTDPNDEEGILPQTFVGPYKTVRMKKPPPPGLPTKTEAHEPPRQKVAGRTQPIGKKRRKGKRKRH